MRVNRRAMVAVRLIRMGLTFGSAIREQLKSRGLKMRAVPFYWMMSRLEERNIVVGHYESIKYPHDNKKVAIRHRCYAIKK